jgi:hypothetical protein
LTREAVMRRDEACGAVPQCDPFTKRPIARRVGATDQAEVLVFASLEA